MMMKKRPHQKLALLCLIILVGSLWLFLLKPKDNLAMIAKTAQGKIRGQKEGPIFVFKGIPYAQPPVGELRWRPPQPHESWNGIRNATKYGPKCLQPEFQIEHPGSYHKFIGSEDCLTLNVWTPDLSPKVDLPVMVYIHGGAYVIGSSSDSYQDTSGKELPGYEGTLLAHENQVVVVTINYRVGILGFLGHPALSAETAYGGSGNYGFMDQIQALKWVQENISNFGGDPKRVTIFGTSAGGSSVTVLLASPQAKNLFSRAIIQSADDYTASLEETEAKGLLLAQKLGCDQAADPLACLRSKSGKELLSALSLSIAVDQRELLFAPNVDNYILPAPRLEMMRTGQHNHVPVIILSTANEYASFMPLVHPTSPTSQEELEKAITDYWNFLPGLAKKLVTRYKVTKNISPYQALINLYSDYSYTCPTRRYAQALAKSQSLPVWRILYAHIFRQGGNLWRDMGAGHGFPEVFLFDEKTPPLDTEEKELGKMMNRYWTRFAATGNPNGKSDPYWKSYLPHQDNYLEFAIPPQEGYNFRKKECDFWDKNLGYHQ